MRVIQELAVFYSQAVIHVKKPQIWDEPYGYKLYLLQTEKFYFAHKRFFSPENFAQKCRKLSQIIMSLIRWSGFSSVDDPDPVNKSIIFNLSS